jgi:excisionase family DNA binding protein
MAVRTTSNGTVLRAVIPAADRIGLSRSEAAEYIGVSASTFDAMVTQGMMPNAKAIGARRVWSRHAVERAFADLPELGRDNGDAARWAA